MTTSKRLYCIFSCTQRMIGLALSVIVLCWLLLYEYQKVTQITYPFYIIVVMITSVVSFLATVISTALFLWFRKFGSDKLSYRKWDIPLQDRVTATPFFQVAIPMCSSPLINSITDRLGLVHGTQNFGFFTTPGFVVMMLSLISIGITCIVLKKSPRSSSI